MGTSFMISPGYAADNENECTVDDIWHVAKNIGAAKVKVKCAEYGLTALSLHGCTCTLDEYLAPYDDLESGALGGKKEAYIYQLATGGNESHRREKEIIRRAFFALLLDECFKRGWAVNVEVC